MACSPFSFIPSLLCSVITHSSLASLRPLLFDSKSATEDRSIMAAADAKSAPDSVDEPFPAPAAPNNPAKLSLPLKTRIAVSLLTHVTDNARRPDGTINRRLLRFLDFKTPANPSPVRGVSSSDVTVDSARGLWFRLFSPSPSESTDAPPLPVVFFFHGGGFTFLSPASRPYDAVCRRFARKLPAVVVSVNYRLCPESRFPSQYDDGFDVLRFVDGRPPELPLSLQNADLGSCFIAGDSAGANIAHHVAVRACKDSSLEAVRIRGIISIQPFFGGEERTEAEIRMPNGPVVSVERTDWLWKAFLPDGEDRDHWAANVSGPKAVEIAKLEGFPEVMVAVAGFDPLSDWQKRYYQWLRKSGKEAEMVEFPNTIHAFYIFPELPESTQLISAVKDFIARKAGPDPSPSPTSAAPQQKL